MDPREGSSPPFSMKKAPFAGACFGSVFNIDAFHDDRCQRLVAEVGSD